MNSEEKWKAVIECDVRYDGSFYYAVKTTGIFCRPSCKAKTPLKKNILFFDTIQMAMQEGFRPCKLCRPDIDSPAYNPNKELAEEAKQLMENSNNKDLSIKAIAHKLGISERHLMRLFRENFGVTPNEYLKTIMVNRSKLLLVSTDLDILDIAYETGFRSISNFYQCFKEQVGASPRKYRHDNNNKENKGENQ